MLKDLCFEVTKQCPNNCLFCSSCSSFNDSTSISYDLFIKTIDHLISQGGIEEISFSGGEPLLHPDILKMILYAHEKGIRTVLFTSGIRTRPPLPNEEYERIKKGLRQKYDEYVEQGLEVEKANKLFQRELDLTTGKDERFQSLSRHNIKQLKAVGLDKIVFDFQAATEENYNELMGTKRHFEYLSGSIICASLEGLETDVHFIPNKINYKDLPDLIEILNIVGCKNLSLLNFVPQGRGKDNKYRLMLSPEELQEFIRIYNESVDTFEGTIRVGIPLIQEDSHKCSAGLSKMVIKYDGTVLPCPAFKEYDLKALNANNIKTPNIHTDLESVQVHPGTRKNPLCKQLYNFTSYIK